MNAYLNISLIHMNAYEHSIKNDDGNEVRQMFGKVATAQPMVLSLRFVCIANQKGGSSIKQ